MKSRLMMTAAAAALAVAGSAHAEQGVTDTEVLLGSNNDLSGPFAAFGAPAVKAAQLYFDDINAAGGVHGRKIRYIVEDHAYQMPKAIAGMNKLINSDKVFAMFQSLGTPMNIAAFKLQDAKKIANVSPLSGARQMLQDPIAYKYAGTSSYYEHIHAGVKLLSGQKGHKVVCAMYLPTDFGKEIQQGAVDAAKKNGLEFKAETTHKPDETDFVGSLSKLKAEGCQLITMALTVRQTITAYATARKIGWTDADFISSSAGFHTVMAKVPGGVTEGLYAAAGWADILARASDPKVAAWMKKYTEASGEQLPGTGALLGRSAAEAIVKALEAAGKDLNADSFRKGMESLNYYDVFLDNQISYGPDDHQGADPVVISVIKDGNWTEIGRE
ncbi:MAG: ABC transporter substrate-binding protein [Pseudomonadota bacterium]